MTIIDFKRKYIFISNMKTGSTAINIFFKQFNPDIIFNKNISEGGLGKHANYKKIKKYLAKRKFNIDDFYIFFFIREPVSRLISCFNYETLNRTKDLKFWYNYKWENTQKDFEKYIRIKSHHFRTVDEMIYDENGNIPKNVNIFKYENYDENLNKILRELNLKNTKNILKINVSKTKTKFNISKEIKYKIYDMYKLDADFY